MRLIKGLPEERLLDRIKKTNRVSGVSQRALGFYLLDFDRRGLYKKNACSSTVHFAYLKLHIPIKKAQALLRVARALEGLPLIDAAFAAGRLPWSAVRELCRVAVKETEAEWLALAEKSSLRKIEALVRRAALGERPPRDPYGLTKAKLKVMAELPMEDYAVWKAAFDRLVVRCGNDLDASTALYLLAKSFLNQPLTKSETEARSAFQVVYHRCSECERAWVQTSEGPAGVPRCKVNGRELEAEVIRVEEEAPVQAKAQSEGQDLAECGGHESVPRVPRGTAVSCENSDPSLPEMPMVPVEARDGEHVPDEAGDLKTGPRVPRVTAVSRENSDPSTPDTPPVPIEERDDPNTPKIRQQVLSRDGQCCATPGCLKQGHLSAHHVKWRFHGGGTVVGNEVCLCFECHGAIHEGILQVNGAAPHGLEWKSPDGKPLEEPVMGPPLERPLYRKEVQEPVPRGTDVSCENSGGGEAEDTTIYSLDEVPDEITLEWWAKYKHNFYFKGNRMMLKKTY